MRVGCLWYPPFVNYESHGKSVIAGGLYPEILKSIAELHNINIDFQILKWNEAIEVLNKGRVDIIACVLKSADRRKYCDFAGTIFRVGVGAVVKKSNNKIRKQSDLINDNVTIAVTKGEIGWTYASENLGLNSYPSRFTVLEDKNIQTMMSLVEGDIVDCALADTLSCFQFIENTNKKSPALIDAFKTKPIHVEDNTLMIANNNEDLKDWLEDNIKKVRSHEKIRDMELEIESQYQDVLIRAVN